MTETGSDRMLAEAVSDRDDINAAVRAAEDETNTEDLRLATTTPAEDEPGTDHPEREPPGAEPDAGYDPLPPT
jgi:hypothetical protein